ncbi:MAG: signal peptidase I [Candidatus Paceibacterota bacterium]|jgi:signal peptidase I
MENNNNLEEKTLTNEEPQTIPSPENLIQDIKTPKRLGIRKDHPVWELVNFALLALVIVIPIRVFIAQPFIVSGGSMIPTFNDGQYLIVDEISYRFHDIARGDVIVFKFPKDTKKYFIKRVVGLPGDTIEINEGKITIKNAEDPEGILLDEPYIKNISKESPENVTLKEKEYYVMGDNRSGSYDSRSWGPVPKKLITGQVFFRLLPFKSISFYPGEFENDLNKN